MHYARLGFSALAVVFAVGCYPVTRMNVPTALQPGQAQFAIAGAVQANGIDGVNIGVTPDIAARVGVASDLELGLRVRSAAIEAGAKYQLAHGAAEVSIAPSLIASEDVDVDGYFDEWHDPDFGGLVVALRNTLYVGTNSSQQISAWVAPSWISAAVTSRSATPATDTRRGLQPWACRWVSCSALRTLTSARSSRSVHCCQWADRESCQAKARPWFKAA